MKTILHCDLNNFFASVECILDKKLIDQYIAVCGDPESRHGIVLAKNSLAKSMGVKTAETIWEAKKKCPQLVCVAPHVDAYAYYSRTVRNIYAQYTDKIESFGIDECWLDVTNSIGMFGTGLQIAEKIRETVKKQTGLTISVGVSWNKSFAKLGSDIKKPDAVTVIDKSNYKQIVWKLPVSEMIFIGQKTSQHLSRLNIFTLGDLAQSDVNMLKKTFGVLGVKLHEQANGYENTAVTEYDYHREIKSVGHGTTTSKDVQNWDDAKCVIFFLSEMVAARMRRYGVAASTVSLDLRFNNLEHISRQISIGGETFLSSVIAKSAVELLIKNWKPQSDLPIRTITVSVSSLTKSTCNIQDNLFSQGGEKKEILEKTLDKIRSKHGFYSVTRASLVQNDFLSDKYCDEDDLLPFKR